MLKLQKIKCIFVKKLNTNFDDRKKSTFSVASLILLSINVSLSFVNINIYFDMDLQKKMPNNLKI
jgi:hypothetical protein